MKEPRDKLQAARESGTTQDSRSSDLIAHIQNSAEHQKALLARELHDELGGLLVGAVMDLAWAEQHLSAPPAELKLKLSRARQTLASAIDLKRKLIEDLRPTLLDNVGLFAALRWHVHTICERAGIACTINLPDDDHRFLPNIPIALFRIVQESFAVIVKHGRASTSALEITINGRSLTLDILSDAAAPPPPGGGAFEAHCLAAIEQRTITVGGRFRWLQQPKGGLKITAAFPLDTVVLAA